MAELRAPERRLLHELWYLDPDAPTPEAPSTEETPPAACTPQGGVAPWGDALRALGWGSR
jgi:hypothetical protein